MEPTTKQRIVDAGTTLFIKRGYSATSMEDITQAAATSKGNLYHHFANKKELFLAVLERDGLQLTEQLAALAGTFPSAIEELYAMAELIAKEGGGNSPLNRAAEELTNTEVIDQAFQDRLLTFFDAQRQLLENLLERAINEGALRPGPVGEYADILQATLIGLEALQDKRTVPLAAICRRSIDLFLHGASTTHQPYSPKKE